MWLFEKLEGSASAYNIASVLRVRGTLDVDALQWAINDIVRRHEVLRTTFEEGDGAPLARIAPQLEIQVARVEFAPTPGQDREDALQQVIEAQVAVEFDLATGPLLRIATVRLAADESLIVAVFHHIVADGWSLRLLERELSQAYARALAGDRTQAPAPALQYRDYVAWQGEWLREGGPRQLDYWKRTLDGGPGCWPMPTRQPRETTRDLGAATAMLALPATLCARVRALP